jgi:hypothetical protein
VAHNARFDLSWISDFSGRELRVLDISGTKVAANKAQLRELLLTCPQLRDIRLNDREWRAAPAANKARLDAAEQRCTADLLRAELLK